MDAMGFAMDATRKGALALFASIAKNYRAYRG